MNRNMYILVGFLIVVISIVSIILGVTLITDKVNSESSLRFEPTPMNKTESDCYLKGNGTYETCTGRLP